MRKLLIALAGAGTLLAAASVAGADRIVLENGNALIGDAVVLDNGDVEVHSAMGVWTVPAARVARVIEEETPEEAVALELRRRPDMSADELVELGAAVREEGAETLALRLFERALAQDPEHEGAHRALGHAFLGGRWLTREELAAHERGLRRADEAARLELETLRAERDRARASRLAEEARLRTLWAQPDRVAPAASGSEDTYGIPIGWVLGAVSSPLLDPFTGLPLAPSSRAMPPAGDSGPQQRVTAPAPRSASRPLPPPTHRGAFRRIGPP